MHPKLVGSSFTFYLQCLNVVKCMRLYMSSSHVSYSVLSVMDPKLVGSGFSLYSPCLQDVKRFEIMNPQAYENLRER